MQARLIIALASSIRILSREGERYEKAYINRHGRSSITSLKRK